MKLYIDRDGTYHGTQADAKASGLPWEQVEVPTDKPSLIAYLNEHCSPPPEQEERSGDPQPEPAPPSPAPSAPAAPPPLTLTDVEEFIQGADAIRLASITQNACYRMAELSKGLNV